MSSSKLCTIRMLATFFWALAPSAQDFVCALVVLRDKKAGVEVNLSKTVFVPIQIGVESESKRSFIWAERPVIHDPFEG